MRILAMETSGRGGSVAALVDADVVVQQSVDATRGSARALAPAIDATLKLAAWKPADVELVGVTAGPGSFTGLRIGLATAKLFAYAVGAKCAAIDTLAAIGLAAPHGEVWTILDAQRSQIFAAKWRLAAAGILATPALTPILPAMVVSIEKWLLELRPGQIVTGPMTDKLLDRLPKCVIVAEAKVRYPTAACVGRLGHEQALRNQVVSPFELAPIYMRRTAAEENWERLGRK